MANTIISSYHIVKENILSYHFLLMTIIICLIMVICFQNHWFTYNETMNIESVTQAVSNLALQFGDDDAEKGAMVCISMFCIIPSEVIL